MILSYIVMATLKLIAWPLVRMSELRYLSKAVDWEIDNMSSFTPVPTQWKCSEDQLISNMLRLRKMEQDELDEVS